MLLSVAALSRAGWVFRDVEVKDTMSTVFDNEIFVLLSRAITLSPLFEALTPQSNVRFSLVAWKRQMDPQLHTFSSEAELEF
jgi:hypothetical protein